MQIAAILTCCIFIYTGGGRKIHITIFNWIWLILIFASTIGFNGLNIPGQETYIYIYFFVLAYNIGATIKQRTSSKKVQYEKNVFIEVFRERTYMVIMIAVLAFFVARYSIKAYEMFREYGGFKLRYYSFNASENYFGSTLDLIIAQKLVQAFVFAGEIFATVRLFDKRKIDKVIIIGYLGALLYALTFQGRLHILAILIMAVTIFLLDGKWDKEFYKRNKKKIRIVGIICFVVIIIVTRSRSISNSSFMKTLTIYALGSPSYMDALLSENLVSWQPFKIIFSGFSDVMIAIVTLIRGVYSHDYLGNYNLNLITNVSHNIGENLSMNSAATAAYILSSDMGIVSVLFGGTLLGYLTNRSYNVYIANRTEKNKCLFVMFMYATLSTYSGWMFCNAYFCFALVLIYVLFRKERRVSV